MTFVFGGNKNTESAASAVIHQDGTPVVETLAPLVPKSQEEISALLSSSKASIQDGKYLESIDSLAVIIEDNPDHQEATALLGAVLLTVNQARMAEDVLFTAVKLSKWTDIISISNLAECLRLTGDLDLSEKVALKGLNVTSSGTAGLRFTLGNIYFAQEKYALAADWYLTSALSEPKNIDIWIAASTVNFPSSARDLKFAENVLLQGIQYNPQSADLRLKLALNFHFSNQLNEAIAFYEGALNLDGSLPGAKASYATALHAAGRLQDAVNAYAEAEREDPRNVVLLCNYGILLCNAGYLVEGGQLVKRAMAVNERHEEVAKATAVCKL